MIGNNTRNGSTCNGVNSSNGHSSNRNITVSTQTIYQVVFHKALKLFQNWLQNYLSLKSTFHTLGGYRRKHRQWKNKSFEVFQAKLIGGGKLIQINLNKLKA